MSTNDKAETLAHRTDWGEVDPRTYPLLGNIKFASEKIGSTERISQANRLIHAVDMLCEQLGEPRSRIHLTIPPGGDARKSVEIRLQPLTQPDTKAEKALVEQVKARWDEILKKGEGRWTAA